MNAAMVSANTGSVINAAQINHRNSLSAPAVQTSTQATTTKAIDLQSSSSIDSSSFKSSSSPIQTSVTSTSAFTAPIDLKSNLASTDTHQRLVSSATYSNNTPQTIVGSDPSSYSLKRGPLNVAGVLNQSQTQLLATGTLAQTAASTDTSTSTNTSDVVNAQPPDNTVNQPSVSSATATNNTAQTAFVDAAEVTAAPQATNTQDEAAQQVEQQLAKKQQHIERVETKKIDQLAQRDTEVKTHEQAHAAVGGSLAQSPSYQYEKGPDGRRYAVDGEVNIDVSTVAGDAQATLTKMQKVYAAAMAPVQPSMADTRVAAQALQNINEANKELIQNRQQDVGSTQKSQHTLPADNIFSSSDNQRQFTSTTDSNNAITPNSRTFTIEGFSGDEANINLLSPSNSLSAERGANMVSNATIPSDTISKNTDSKNTTVAERNSARQIETSLSSPERYQQQHQSIEIYV
jgi:hypothetical protein